MSSEHRAHRLPEGGGRRVGADQRQADAAAGDPADRADEVENPLAALEPADVEQAQQDRPRARRPRRPALAGSSASGLRTITGLGSSPSTALVGPEHVAARPQDVVAVGQRVPLQLVGEPRLELVGQMSVEDVGDLGGGAAGCRPPSGAACWVNERAACVATNPSPRKSENSTRSGPPPRSTRQPSRARWRSSDAAGCRENPRPPRAAGSETNRTRRSGNADRCPRQLGVVPAMALGGEHGHLGDGRQRARGRGDVGADATAPKERQLAGDRRDLRALGAHRGRCDQAGPTFPPA